MCWGRFPILEAAQPQLLLQPDNEAPPKCFGLQPPCCLGSQEHPSQSFICFPWCSSCCFPAKMLCLLALLSKDSSSLVCFVWKLLNPTLHVSKHKACLTVSAFKLDVKWTFFPLLKKEKGLPVDVFTGAGLFWGSDFLLLIGINTYLCFANKRMHVGLRIFASWAVQGNVSKAISCFSNEVGGQSRCLSTFSPRNTSWWVKPECLWLLEGSLWKCAGWKSRTRTGSVLSEHSWEFTSSQVPLPCDLCEC